MALPAPLPPPPRRVLGTRLQLSDEAAARIRELIMDGRVRPGDYLRLERLALEFGISVTPVREALKSLRSEGFVVLEPRRGFVVAPLSKRDVQDLFWVQAGIAAELAARAVPRIRPAALRELDGLQLGLEHAMAVRRPDLMEDGNHRFHREINLAAGSPKLAWSLGTAARYVPRGLYGRLAGLAGPRRPRPRADPGGAAGRRPAGGGAGDARPHRPGRGTARRPPRTPRHVEGGEH
ncbi:GntR family transcriptional regulator [Actinomadura madurae]|nr:GntR family transcriptional regulator [Actinomadura madurae]MCQ0006298.1 GntR family transcriptional regulator [Actinomadura madurae]